MGEQEETWEEKLHRAVVQIYGTDGGATPSEETVLQALAPLGIVYRRDSSEGKFFRLEDGSLGSRVLGGQVAREVVDYIREQIASQPAFAIHPLDEKVNVNLDLERMLVEADKEKRLPLPIENHMLRAAQTGLETNLVVIDRGTDANGVTFYELADVGRPSEPGFYLDRNTRVTVADGGIDLTTIEARVQSLAQIFSDGRAGAQAQIHEGLTGLPEGFYVEAELDDSTTVRLASVDGNGVEGSLVEIDNTVWYTDPQILRTYVAGSAKSETFTGHMLPGVFSFKRDFTGKVNAYLSLLKDNESGAQIEYMLIGPWSESTRDKTAQQIAELALAQYDLSSIRSEELADRLSGAITNELRLGNVRAEVLSVTSESGDVRTTHPFNLADGSWYAVEGHQAEQVRLVQGENTPFMFEARANYELRDLGGLVEQIPQERWDQAMGSAGGSASAISQGGYTFLFRRGGDETQVTPVPKGQAHEQGRPIVYTSGNLTVEDLHAGKFFDMFSQERVPGGKFETLLETQSGRVVAFEYKGDHLEFYNAGDNVFVQVDGQYARSVSEAELAPTVLGVKRQEPPTLDPADVQEVHDYESTDGIESTGDLGESVNEIDETTGDLLGPPSPDAETEVEFSALNIGMPRAPSSLISSPPDPHDTDQMPAVQPIAPEPKLEPTAPAFAAGVHREDGVKLTSKYLPDGFNNQGTYVIHVPSSATKVGEMDTALTNLERIIVNDGLLIGRNDVPGTVITNTQGEALYIHEDGPTEFNWLRNMPEGHHALLYIIPQLAANPTVTLDDAMETAFNQGSVVYAAGGSHSPVSCPPSPISEDLGAGTLFFRLDPKTKLEDVVLYRGEDEQGTRQATAIARLPHKDVSEALRVNRRLPIKRVYVTSAKDAHDYKGKVLNPTDLLTNHPAYREGIEGPVPGFEVGGSIEGSHGVSITVLSRGPDNKPVKNPRYFLRVGEALVETADLENLTFYNQEAAEPSLLERARTGFAARVEGVRGALASKYKAWRAARNAESTQSSQTQQLTPGYKERLGQRWEKLSTSSKVGVGTLLLGSAVGLGGLVATLYDSETEPEQAAIVADAGVDARPVIVVLNPTAPSDAGRKNYIRKLAFDAGVDAAYVADAAVAPKRVAADYADVPDTQVDASYQPRPKDPTLKEKVANLIKQDNKRDLARGYSQTSAYEGLRRSLLKDDPQDAFYHEVAVRCGKAFGDDIIGKVDAIELSPVAIFDALTQKHQGEKGYSSVRQLVGETFGNQVKEYACK